MVRLRTEKWYSGDGQRHSRKTVATRSTGSRRLVSLFFLLALVVMMMQKASDPKVISRAFEAVGVPLDGKSDEATTGLHSPKAPLSKTSGEPVSILTQAPPKPLNPQQVIWQAACRDLSTRLVQQLSQSELDTLAQAILYPASAESTKNTPAWTSLSTKSQSQLRAIQEQLDPASPEDTQWASTLEKYQESWNALLSNDQDAASPSGKTAQPGNSNQQVFSKSLSLAIDARLFADLKMSEVWKSKEKTAFWRLLQKGRAGPTISEHMNAPTVSTLQLEADSKNLRGELVRFRGELKRLTATNRINPLNGNMESYWVAWMRGEDQSNQPIAVYLSDAMGSRLSTSLPGNFTPVNPDNGKSTPAEITGYVGKRFAYAGQQDIQVAPSLFASDARLLKASGATTGETQTNASPLATLAWAGGVAALIGGLFAMALLPGFQRRAMPQSPTRRPGKRNGQRAGMLILAASALAPSLSAATPQDSDGPMPPWANQTEETSAQTELIQTLIRERGSQTLTNNALEEIRQTVAAGSPIAAAGFPDSVLQMMRLLQQTGWNRINQLPATLLNSQDLRLENSQRTGWAVGVRRVRMSEIQSNWFRRAKTDQVYQITCQVDANYSSPAFETTLFTTLAPTLWLTAPKLHQPIQIQGIWLTAGKDSAPLCVFCESAAWLLPKDASADAIKQLSLAPQLPAHLIALGTSGWDLTHLAKIGLRSREPLSNQESESYFSLMRTVAESPRTRATADRTTPKSTGDQRDPHTLLMHPRQNAAAPVQWTVRLVTGNTVELSDVRSQELLNRPRYFQIDGFVAIGNRSIQYEILNTQGKRERVLFEREFPITLVISDAALIGNTDILPTAARSGKIRTWKINRYVEASGFFYRLWSYQSDLLENRSNTARQTAPLVIVSSLRPTSPPVTHQSNPAGWFGVALCGAVLAFLALILYFSLKKDPRRRSFSATGPPHS